MAAVIVPRPRRADWRREWTAELTSLGAAGVRTGRRRAGVLSHAEMLRHALICFADARQLRRLARPHAAASERGRGGRSRGGPQWKAIEPLHATRRAARSLMRSPVFSGAAILTLGLGIGANTAIFSLINAIVLKPPAVEAPDRLVRIYTSTPEGQAYGPTSYVELQDIADQTELFEGIVGHTLTVGALVEDGRVEALLGEVVTGNYFEVLGVPMALGRAFNPEESVAPGTHPVVVLGHGFWNRRFAADPAIVGTTLRLNGVAFDIIGVASADYQGMLPGIASEFWAPAMMIGRLMPDVPEALESRTSRQFMTYARLRDGVTVEQAQGAVSLVANRLEASFPESNGGHGMTVMAAEDVRFNPRIDGVILPVAMLLLCVPALVLLIACTNLAGLLLARATDRRKEIAVRLALGAGRRHIVGQLLGESLLLSVLGGALGVLMASWLMRVVLSFMPPLLVNLSLELGLDHRVLGFALAVSVLAGLIFGLLPALKSSKPELSRALKGDDGIVWRARRISLRDALVVGQVAVSMLLLLVAGLFARSLQMAQTVDPGFDTQSSVVFSMNAAIRYDEPNGREYYRRLVERMASVPGATSVALADRLPLGMSSQTMQIITDDLLPGVAAAAGDDGNLPIDFARISPDYFRTLGIDLVAGRDFDARDRQKSTPVTIVSVATARLLWGDESPLGKQIRRPGGRALEVVGVARDTRVRTLGEAVRPYLYVPFEQRYESVMELIVATDRDPTVFLAAAQEAILQLDPEVMPLELMTMADGNNVMLFPVRAAAWSMGAFGALGLLLSAVGIVGTLAYSVAQRGHETGVRLALGASPSRLVRMVVGGGMRLVGVGMAIGILLALAVGRLLEGLLIAVSPSDPLAFVGISLLLAAVALLASYIPARRAAAADPLTVLRQG